MTHLNFCRNNGKPAAVASWGLGDEGGMLSLGGGQLESWGEAPPQKKKKKNTPLHSLSSNNMYIGRKNKSQCVALSPD